MIWIMSDLIGAYLAHLRAAGFSPATVRDRDFLLRRLVAELPHGLDNACADELASWLGRAGWSRWTRYTYFESLFAFYTWAASGRRPHLDYNPMVELTRPRVPVSEPRPVSDEQLLAALGMPRPWRTAVTLAAFGGLRCAEIARLVRDDVDERSMRVLRKGGKVMQLPVHPQIWAEVRDMPAGPCVPRPSGRAYSPASLSAKAGPAFVAAGLVGVTLHRFRHYFASRLLLPRELGGAGADVRTVQELLGHASVATTQIYTLVTDRQRHLAVSALPVPTSPELVHRVP